MGKQSVKIGNGGQRGCASNLENQSAILSNSAIGRVEKAGEIGASANRVQLAALWLHQHRNDVSGAIIPALKQRFGLRNLEAIEAAKQAHALAYGGRHG